MRNRILAIALTTLVAAQAWAPPCNYLVFPNACIDDYLETCLFVDVGLTRFECYTNGDGCCGCIYYPIEYYCPLLGTRYGQESERVDRPLGVCTEGPGGSVSCIPTLPPGGG